MHDHKKIMKFMTKLRAFENIFNKSTCITLFGENRGKQLWLKYEWDLNLFDLFNHLTPKEYSDLILTINQL